MDAKKTATEILRLIGGPNNINNVTHCYTRLRFKLKDESIVNKQELEKVDDVVSIVQSSGQYQVVIGTEVDKVYKELIGLTGQKVDTEVESKKNRMTIKEFFSNALDVLISSFTPLIPVIAGSGMIKVLISLLVYFNLLKEGSTNFVVLSAIGDGVYYFLPLFVAMTAARRLKVDQTIAMAMAAILMYPTLASLLTEGQTYSSFLGLPLRVLDYSTQALPVILAVVLIKYVDKFSEKISPNLFKVFLRPMITLLISAPIVLLAVGPFASIVGEYFMNVVSIMNNWGFIAVGINAVLFPFLVMIGIHNALIPLIIQVFATQGFDSVFIPSGLVANISEAGAAGAVAFKTKNKKLKGVAISATISACFGITEPALYGVNLRLKRPFLAMLVGALIGGSFAGLMGVTAYSFVSPSILSLPIFINPATTSLLWAIVTVPVTFIVTFILTLLFGFEDIVEEEAVKKNVEIDSPTEGKIISLEDVNDSVFSSKLLGEGFAVLPESDQVTSPVEGTVISIFPTKHAIGLRSKDGTEVLIHIGLETVELQGRHFESLVADGDTVTIGQPLIKFDREAIATEGYDNTVICVVTNMNEEQKKHTVLNSKGLVFANE